MFTNLSEICRHTLSEKFSIKDVSVSWKRPQQDDHGDIATAIAMQVAKKAEANPRHIAEVLMKALESHADVERVELAGPGYINIWLTTEALIAALQQSSDACTPQQTRTSESPVIVEYSSPNIAKPLGIHHILTTVIGQVIANLHTHLGYNVETVNHVGDWGTQFGKLAVAWQRWSEGILLNECSVDDLLKLYVRFHDEAEKDETLEDAARAEFKKLEEGDTEVREFWKTVVDISMSEIHTLYDRLNVSIEHDHGESMYEDMMMPIIEEGKQKGVFKEGKEGALIAEFSEESHLPPAIVLKSDMSTIYHTRDLATIKYRMNRWHPKTSVYVVGMEQQMYFQQLFAMVEQLEWDLPHLEHVYFGRMRFADGAMSTRKGKVLKLEDVLDEAERQAEEVIKSHGEKVQTDDAKELARIMGIGALSYGILSQNRKQDILFDWEKVLSFEGNSAPYLQYTHARARSILRKAEDEHLDLDSNITLEPKDRVLLNTLLQFPRILEEACTNNMPHTLSNFLYQLCQDFNAFYNDLPILKAEDALKALRLHLTEATADILKAGATILTLRVPDRM